MVWISEAIQQLCFFIAVTTPLLIAVFFIVVGIHHDSRCIFTEQLVQLLLI